jgi:fluoride ion exporter CrcB/FEX
VSRLSALNAKGGRDLCPCVLPDWFPWGTFAANILAATLAACLIGLDDRYFSGTDPLEKNWVHGLLFALNTGLAGSLSTVSTMIKETIIMAEQNPGIAKPHYYTLGTCFSGMLLGLTVYATTVRINS